MGKTFVLSDESLNCYGFWVRTSGIKIDQFKKNPIMLWNHNRPWRGTEDEVLPIGKWENVRIEDGKLLADAVFDQNDEFAKKIESKVESGILNMCSIGIHALDESEDKAWLKPGQTRRTVLKCKLREASICDIGANDNALALYDDNGAIINLSASGDIPVKLLSNNNIEDMKSIALKLGLSENAGENDILTSIQALKDKTANILTLSADSCKKLGVDQKTVTTESVEAAITSLASRAEKAEKTLKDQDDAKCTALVDNAVKEGRITAELKDTYMSMAKSDYSAAEKAIAAIPAKENLADQAGKGGYEPGSVWSKRQEEIRKGDR